MVELDDREFEFDRLASSLDRQAILAYAQQCSIRQMCSLEKLRHIAAVGELSARYADALDDDVDLMHHRYRRQICEAAGFLHEAMLHGASFEDVVRQADEAVARVVAAVTPDVREPGPVRSMHAANRVGLGGVAAQIVKLADLRHDCDIQNKLAEVDPVRVRLWIDDAAVMLGSFHKLASTQLAGRVQALKSAIDDLDAKTRAHRRKVLV